MGYVFRYEDAQRYNAWFHSEPGRTASALEKELLLRLWAPTSCQRILEVGCGTGLFLEWFDHLGHQVTGIDPSPFMLSVAREHLPRRITLDRGYAEELPYGDNEYDTVALITTLEFVDDPAKALKEAFRVARRYVLLGSFNRYSIITGLNVIRRLWKPTIYSHARFFSVLELRRLVDQAMSGTVPIRWGTCLSFPLVALRYLYFLERCRYFHAHPFGHFIAMRADVSYRMQTIQEPLFCQVASGIGHAPIRSSCWRTRDREANGRDAQRMSPTGSGRRYHPEAPVGGTP